MILAAIMMTIAVPGIAQYQYRTDDNSDIIRSILEDSVSVRKQPAAGQTADAVAPAQTQKTEGRNQNSGAAKRQKKKKGGELPAAAGPDKTLLVTGMNLLDAGNDPAAIEKFRQIKEKYAAGPYSDQASIWLARAYIKQGKYKEAVDETQKIAEDSGEYPAAVYLSGQIFSTQRQYDKALDAFYRISSRFPGHDLADNALIDAGKIYMSMKNGTQALSAASIIVRSYPDRETLPDAYFLIGQVLEKDPAMRDIEKARLVFRKFVYRAETEKVDSFARSPLLDRVKRELEYLDKNFFRTK
jgi:outer membrane protein assembly factor BamD (BamD/ComL family)